MENKDYLSSNLMIKYIANGGGEESPYFVVGRKYDKRKLVAIKKEEKIIGKGLYNDLTLICYVGYDENGNAIFSINEGINLEVGFTKPSKID